MKFLVRLSVLLYSVLVLATSVIVVLIVLQQMNLIKLFNLLAYIRSDEVLKTVVLGIVGFIVIVNYVCYYHVLKANATKNKVIAFDNPSGRVSVSLAAIEDLTKRAIISAPEVREVKSKISASKKGLLIKITLILRVEGSIPELTSRVQELVKKKVQDAIGLDEPIEVAIYVGKIISDQGKEKRSPKKKEIPKEQEPNVPFQGYRA